VALLGDVSGDDEDVLLAADDVCEAAALAACA
jgi:hypothetical protein